MRDFSIVESRILRFFFGWHFLSVIFALVIGISSGDFNLFLSLSIWTTIAVIAYKLEPPYYILSALVLSALEELVVYSFGGGLQGAATSLTQDYANSLPIFLSIILVWRFVLGRYEVNEEELYLVTIVPAVFIELLFQGVLYNPILLFLLGGPAFFIYGSIMGSPKLPRGELEFSLKIKMMTIVLMIASILVVAIIMTDINNMLALSS